MHHRELLEQFLISSANLTGKRFTRNNGLDLLLWTITRRDLTRRETLEMVEMLLQSVVDPNILT